MSIANAIGFAEILMRDDKPYGVELEVEYKVRLVEEEKASAEPSAPETEATHAPSNETTDTKAENSNA